MSEPRKKTVLFYNEKDGPPQAIEVDDDSEAKFYEALGKAQAEIKPPTKDQTATVTSKRTGQTFTYQYAGLPDVLDAMRAPLRNNGLTVVQLSGYDPAVKCAVVTTIIYGHGHRLESPLHIPCGDSAQDIGSAQTYGRRYALVGLGFMCPEDDDDGQRSNAGRKPEKKPATATALDKLTIANALFKGTAKAAVTLGLYPEGKADNAQGLLFIINDVLGATYAQPKDVGVAALERVTQELKDRIKITEAERAQK